MSPKWHIGERIRGRREIYEIFKGGRCVVYVVYDHVAYPLCYYFIINRERHMPTKRKEGIPSTPKRKQAFDQKFISPRQLAIRWDLSLSAVYHGEADVNLLRRISFGRSIRFLLSEVEAVEAQKIALAN